SLVVSDDGGFSWRGVDIGGHYTITTIAVSPQSSEIAYLVAACFYDKVEAGGCVLLATKDGGMTWRDEFPSLQLAMRKSSPMASDLQRIASVVVDPKNSNIVYVTAPEQVFRSEDGGMSWSR